MSRALRTIDRSQDLGLKMMKQPAHKQMDYYYSKLLGADWQKQLEQVGVGTLIVHRKTPPAIYRGCCMGGGGCACRGSWQRQGQQ